MLLTLDRGNTTLDVMLHGPSPRRARLQGNGDLAGFLGSSSPDMAVAVSVVPGGLDEALSGLRSRGVRVGVAGQDLPCPLPLDYSTPATLGPDRWLSALAAHRRLGRSVVVDCGSATTVNLVEQDGTFRGGAVAPGLRALSTGMAVLTPSLPAYRPEVDIEIPPRSTAAAIDAGVMMVFCGGIERMVSEMLTVARGPCVVCITGGNAAAYMRHGRMRPRWEPSLVHEGLRLLAGESGWSF